MEKLPLKRYYEGLPIIVDNRKTKFRELLAKECGVEEVTVYRWINGLSIPDKLKREKIAEIVGIPVESLFPEAYPVVEEKKVVLRKKKGK